MTYLQVLIKAAVVKQLLKHIQLNDLAILDHQQMIRIPDDAQAVDNEKTSTFLEIDVKIKNDLS